METVADIPELAALPVPLETDAARPSRLVDFYELTKPRMNFLVVVTTMVGFYMALPRGFSDWARLVHTLLDQNLVDELRLLVYPVALGAGDRLFGPTSAPTSLRLTGAGTVGEGLAQLTYRR